MSNIIVKEVKVKDYLTKSKLPASDYVINPYVGCTHGCKYCYASFMKRFTKHNEEWGDFIDIKRCANKIDTKKLMRKTIFLSSVTDCYNSYEKEYELTRNILKQLIGIDCTVNISTKSKLILRDLDILKQLSHVTVAMSINTVNEDFRKNMDCASSIEERFACLKTLHENGIYTIVFISPIFPYITEWQQIIEASCNYVDEYWFENLNLRGSYKKVILNHVKENYPKIYPFYIEIYERKKKDYWKLLSQEIETYCTRKKIKYKNYFYHEEIVKK